MDLALPLLLIRLLFGLTFAAHGAQKLFGWFGGYGIAGTGGFFETLGFRPGRAFAVAAGLAEFGGGLLIALGLLGPLEAALVVSAMLVAIVAVHLRNGWLATSNGVELPLLYLLIGAGYAFGGFGPLSLDAALGLGGLWSPALAWVFVGLGFVGGLANLAARRKAPASEAPAEALDPAV